MTYRTVQGDRWDMLAYRFYGDAMRFEPIITANPNVPAVAVLDGGIELTIPMLEPLPVALSPEMLPPWAD